MPPKPDVSVILCVRNGADVIARQLDALDSQSVSCTYEVIVIDNGSSDDTVKVIDRVIKDSTHLKKICRLIDGADASGLPQSRNLGSQRAEADILAFCDADDRVDAEWVQSYFDELNHQTALLGGKVNPVDEAGRAVSVGIGEGLVATPYLLHVPGCNFAINRRAYLEVGGFDEGLPRYGFDDVDFSWRVQQAGYEINYVPGAIVDFTVSSNSASIRKRFYLGVGRVLMARRYPSYDSNPYKLLPTAGKALRQTFDFLLDTLKTKGINRKSASQLVAQYGRVYGSILYRGKNYCPAPQLLKYQ
ncbi:glycosyl transferase family protein [Mycobacteroides abscessus subsp. bolletii]|nr:glycosyl transferase family protein [Mycobacteroides abscessus subsp. bolletii]